MALGYLICISKTCSRLDLCAAFQAGEALDIMMSKTVLNIYSPCSSYQNINSMRRGALWLCTRCSRCGAWNGARATMAVE